MNLDLVSNDADLDKDNDGLTNLQEFQLNTKANSNDSDGDGIHDGYEVNMGLNPNDPSDALLDSDGDFISNLEEFNAGTNSQNPFSVPIFSLSLIHIVVFAILAVLLTGLLFVFRDTARTKLLEPLNKIPNKKIKLPALFAFFIIAIFGVQTLISFLPPPTYQISGEIKQDFDISCLDWDHGSLKAATYDNTTIDEIHPIYIAFDGDDSTSDVFNNLFLPETSLSWQPNKTAEVELLACVSINRDVIQTCTYLDDFNQLSEVARIQWVYSIVIRVARTGELLELQTFEGGLPETCPANLDIGVSTLYGTKPHNNIFNWLEDWVES